MADGYGEVAPYGDLPYKQDGVDDEERHFKIMMAMFPVKQLLEDDDE